MVGNAIKGAVRDAGGGSGKTRELSKIVTKLETYGYCVPCAAPAIPAIEKALIGIGIALGIISLSEAVDDDEPQPQEQSEEETLRDKKKLSPGEIKTLQENGIDPHELKEGYSSSPSHEDLYKDKQGNVYVGAKNGTVVASQTGVNLNNVRGTR